MALRGTLTHRKTRRLALALSIPPCFALGVLESLWHVTGEQAADGAIGRMTDADLAMEMFYDGDPTFLVDALVTAGLVDRDDNHRLVVHDWHLHSDDATDNRLSRATRTYANGVLPRMTKLSKPERANVCARFSTAGHKMPLPVPVPEPVPVPVPVKEQKPTRAKTAHVELPGWIQLEAWEGYLDVRRKKRAVMTERALHGILDRLGEFRARGHDPNAVLATSMRSNWTDVYEPKGANNAGTQHNQGRGQQRVEQAIDELRKAGVEIEDRRVEESPREVWVAAGGSGGRDSPGLVFEGAR